MKKLINFYKRLSFFQGAVVATSLTSVVGITATVTGLHSFNPGATISSSQMNDNFTILKNAVESTSSQQYVGTYNAGSAIYPTASAVAGDYYIVTTAGTISGVAFNVGDWIIYNGSAWSKIPSSATITSVFGRTGSIMASEGDYTLDQLLDVDLTSPPAAGEYLKYNGTHWVAETETDPTVQNFAKMPLPSCAAGEVLKSTGSTFSCITDNAGAPAFTGTANKVVTTNGTGDLTTGSVTTTELGYLSGVTSSLQTQLNTKQATSANLTSLAAYNTNGILVQTSTNTFTGRTIEGTVNRVIVTNGNGVAGNPTLDISTALLPSPVSGDVGKYLKATAGNMSAWTTLSPSDVTTALGYMPLNKTGDTITSGTFTFNGSAALRTMDPIALTDVANKQYVDSFGQWGKIANNISYTLGNVGIGTTSPAYTLHVNGQVAGTSAFMTTSDVRYKKDISRVTNSLEKLLSITGVSYKFRTDEFPESKFSTRRELGVIAQNVEKVFPEAVSKDSQGFRSVAYTMLISPIIEAIREVNSKTKRLEDENKMLKSYLCERDPSAPFCDR